MKSNLIEQLADQAHKSWSGWIDWMFEKMSLTHYNGETFIERWNRQAKTPYAELSEAEKESDREEAMKYLGVFTRYVQQVPGPVVFEVVMERLRQDLKWGGPSHDDLHSEEEWIAMIDRLIGEVSENAATEGVGLGDYRKAMIQVAAVALAFVESIDRKSKSDYDSSKNG